MSLENVKSPSQRDTMFFAKFYRDLYERTWLCSHVRFFEIEPDRAADDLTLLRSALLHRYPTIESAAELLMSARIEKKSAEDLNQLLDHAISDLKEGEEEAGMEGGNIRNILESLDVEKVVDVSFLGGNPYAAGPTYRAFWRIGGRFQFLEIHNES